MFLSKLLEKGRVYRMSSENASDNRDTKQVFVCGAGHQGLSMAAHLALCGTEL